jgi:hypothetical protein
LYRGQDVILDGRCNIVGRRRHDVILDRPCCVVLDGRHDIVLCRRNSVVRSGRNCVVLNGRHDVVLCRRNSVVLDRGHDVILGGRNNRLPREYRLSRNSARHRIRNGKPRIHESVCSRNRCIRCRFCDLLRERLQMHDALHELRE